MVIAIGLPQFSDSIATSFSAFASSASAILSKAFWRVDGVASRHPGNAAAAAFSAASTSASFEFGAVAKTFPVAGFTNSVVLPDLESTDFPFIKFCSAFTLKPFSEKLLSRGYFGGG